MRILCLTALPVSSACMFSAFPQSSDVIFPVNGWWKNNVENLSGFLLYSVGNAPTIRLEIFGRSAKVTSQSISIGELINYLKVVQY